MARQRQRRHRPWPGRPPSPPRGSDRRRPRRGPEHGEAMAPRAGPARPRSGQADAGPRWNDRRAERLGELRDRLGEGWEIIVLGGRGQELASPSRGIAGRGRNPVVRVEAAGTSRPEGRHRAYPMGRLAESVRRRGLLPKGEGEGEAEDPPGRPTATNARRPGGRPAGASFASGDRPGGPIRGRRGPRRGPSRRPSSPAGRPTCNRPGTTGSAAAPGRSPSGPSPGRSAWRQGP